MQRPFASMPSDVVDNAMEVERVVAVEGQIRVRGARATGVSFLVFFFVLTTEFASV